MRHLGSSTKYADIHQRTNHFVKTDSILSRVLMMMRDGDDDEDEEEVMGFRIKLSERRRNYC
jgi:hypothetical protein